MKYRRWLSLPILVVLSSAVQAGTSTNVMTRQNQADLNCAITVQVRTNAVQNWYTFTVSVPKEDTRLKRLFRTAFVRWKKPLPLSFATRTLSVRGSMCWSP